MSVWVLPGFLLFLVVSSWVGVRLILLWWRTGQLPELLIGLGVLGIGPVGFGMSACGSFLAASAPGPALMLALCGAAAATGGIVAKLVFNWRVYHRDDPWVGRVTLALVGLAVLLLPFGATLGGFRNGLEVPAWALTRGLLQAAALLWGASEAVMYWDKMRRRTKLGLADPVVANRFLLWGLAAASAGLGTAIGVTFQIATGIPSMEVPALMLSSSLHGLVAAVAMWLAFVPPRVYTRWVRGRAEQPAAA